MAPEKTMPEPEPERELLFTVEEMCKLLQVDRRTMCDWVQYRKIPYVKLDKKYVRFRMSEVAQWIKKKQKVAQKNKFHFS